MTCTDYTIFNDSACAGSSILKNFTNDIDCVASTKYSLLECVTTPIVTFSIYDDAQCKTLSTSASPFVYFTTERCMQWNPGKYGKVSIGNGSSALSLDVYSNEWCNDTSPNSSLALTLGTCASMTLFSSTVHVIPSNGYKDAGDTNGGGSRAENGEVMRIMMMATIVVIGIR